MSLTEWAKKEVELWKKSGDEDDDMFEYADACVDSALKAFMSLTEDGHNGHSIHITKHMLNRLIDQVPLTPITGEDDEWEEIDSSWEIENGYQNKRRSSLFKRVYSDDRVEYRDHGIYYAIDIVDGTTFTHFLIEDIVNEMFPITFPYEPPVKKYSVAVEFFGIYLSEGEGDNTFGIYFLRKPGGEKVLIDKYYKRENGEMIPISFAEFNERKHIHDGSGPKEVAND